MRPPGSGLWPGAASAGKTREFWDHVQEGRHFSGIERHLAEFYPEPQTLWDFLPPETVVVEWDPLILAQDLEKQEDAAAAEPQGWLDQTPWAERRAPFATVFCHVLALGATRTGPGFHHPGRRKTTVWPRN